MQSRNIARWVENLSEKGGVLSLSLNPKNPKTGDLAVGTPAGRVIVYGVTGVELWKRRHV